MWLKLLKIIETVKKLIKDLENSMIFVEFGVLRPKKSWKYGKEKPWRGGLIQSNFWQLSNNKIAIDPLSMRLFFGKKGLNT